MEVVGPKLIVPCEELQENGYLADEKTVITFLKR